VALIRDLLLQGVQIFLLLLLAPLLLGGMRLLRARLLRRRGPSPFQVYRDLLRLLRKEVVVADSASWLFRAAPHLLISQEYT
jgi:formate hydrogenlyase subunit 4